MADINWEKVWNNTIKNKELFPINAVKDNTLSISCPTRFSKTGEFSIDITPSFNDNSISLELRIFNDNLSIDDLSINKDADKKDSLEFNSLADELVKYELLNRVVDRFTIESDGFNSESEAEDALIDYINNKATESGHMFDDKLDELNDAISNKDEKYSRIINTIRENRSIILQKVSNILSLNYKWKSAKTESFDDTTTALYNKDGTLAAVISLVDDCVIVDLAKGISSKISLMQSDEDIETELVRDVEAAQEVLADREIEQLKDVVSDEQAETDYLESLSRRVTRLESLYISNKLHKVY